MGHGRRAFTAAQAAKGIGARDRRICVAVQAGKGFGAKPQPAPPMQLNAPCPCTKGITTSNERRDYGACCNRFHQGALPSTAEELLRARYSAYTIKLPDYIVATTNPDSPEHQGSPNTYIRAVKQTMRRVDYKGLEVLEQEEEGNDASITFRTSFVDKMGKDNSAQIHTERSTFVRTKGEWSYVASCSPNS